MDVIDDVLVNSNRDLRSYFTNTDIFYVHRVFVTIPASPSIEHLYSLSGDCTLPIPTRFLVDVHAILDNLKAPLDLVAHRTEYNQRILTTVFATLDITTSKLKFVKRSSYQVTKQCNLDNYELCAIVSEHDAKKAGAEFVKQVESLLL